MDAKKETITIDYSYPVGEPHRMQIDGLHSSGEDQYLFLDNPSTGTIHLKPDVFGIGKRDH